MMEGYGGRSRHRSGERVWIDTAARRRHGEGDARTMADQKLIVVTGVSRGLGHALLPQFIERGHTVFGCSRSPDAARALGKQYGPPHDFSALDVRVDLDVQLWALRVLDRARAPDMLINNAALINRPAPLWEIQPDEFSDLIDVNVKGVYHVVRHFLPGMIGRGAGIVVNISSGWGRSTSPEVAPYCASKWAVEGLSQALAAEVPAGLAVVALNPGIINTDMLQICFGANAAGYPSADAWALRPSRSCCGCRLVTMVAR